MRTAIIGGGAAGLFAAWQAALRGDRVTVLERNDRVGKKLLLTGAGRCNLTNDAAGDPARYHGSVDVRPALQALPPAALEQALAALGLYLRRDGAGRVYPWSGQAAAVLDTLRFGAQAAGAVLRTGAAVTALARTDGGFCLTLADGTQCHADRVLFCAGGGAAPATGSDGTALALVRPLGHTPTPLRPGLAPIRTDPALLRGMEGLRVMGRAALERDGVRLDARDGEIQLTKQGAVSGICVLELSRHVRGGETLCLDLLPELRREQALALLRRRPVAFAEDRLGGLINKRVGLMLARGIQTPEALIDRVKDWRLPVLGVGAFRDAQVTVGGIPGGEIDPATMESKLVPGLYFCGEALDVDGDCGGFNLHWAFASAFLAARGGQAQ